MDKMLRFNDIIILSLETLTLSACNFRKNENAKSRILSVQVWFPLLHRNKNQDEIPVKSGLFVRV